MDPRIHSRQVSSGHLSWHILECGDIKHDIILLLHGFPELAFSWRKVMPLLADAGYHVIAPDLRGYGDTVTTHESTIDYHDGAFGYAMIDTTSEIVDLMTTLFPSRVVRAVVGHDMGSAIAANLALIRPDIFQSLVMMSAPYTGPPGPVPREKTETLAALSQHGRRHYQVYFCQETANDDLMQAKQGLADFYRGYYYFKSAHHPQNHPHSLGEAWNIDGILQLPEYYIMKHSSSMPDTVARHVDIEEAKAAMHWMSQEELNVYVRHFQRTGFQGGLNHYRARMSGLDTKQLALFAGMLIAVPATFISGAQDWGNYQDPGALDKMQSESVVKPGLFRDPVFIRGAGHWVQQEQPAKTVQAILNFIQHM